MTQTTDLVKAIQYLYAHEINCRISTFWDGDVTIQLGDEMNGFVRTDAYAIEDIADMGRWLIDEAKKIYPDCKWKEMS